MVLRQLLIRTLVLMTVFVGAPTVLRAQGIATAWPGDNWDGYTVAYFDDEETAAERAVKEAVEAATEIRKEPAFGSNFAAAESVQTPRLAVGPSGTDALRGQVADLEKTLQEYDEAFENIEKQMQALEKLADLEAMDERVSELEDSDDIDDIASDLESLTEDFEEFSGDDTIVHSGSSASTMKISGRIHADYWSFPENSAAINELEGGPAGPQSRFAFRRLRFGVGGKLVGNMLYKIEMEFAGGNNSEFRDAYFGWTDIPFFQKILIGNQKRPYGLDHLNSSRYNVFLERPFVIESFNQDARRLGVQSYRVSEDQRWNARLGIFNQRLVQDEGNYTNDNLQLEVAARLANTFWYDEVSNGRGYGHWAISHSWASPDGEVGGDSGSTGPDQNEARFRHRPEARSATRWLDTGRIEGCRDYHLWGLEGVLNFGSLQLAGEAQYVNMNRDGGSGSDLSFFGWYCYASYFLTGEHIPWKRSSGTLDRVKPFENFFLVDTLRNGAGGGWGAWQIAARYSYLDLESADILGGRGQSLTIGLNWHWTSNSRMQFNWLHGQIKNNEVTRDESLGGMYDIIGTRFMVDF